jgi:hypothetical protein
VTATAPTYEKRDTIPTLRSTERTLMKDIIMSATAVAARKPLSFRKPGLEATRSVRHAALIAGGGLLAITALAAFW